MVIIALLLFTWVDGAGVLARWRRDRGGAGDRAVTPPRPVWRPVYTAVLTTVYVSLAIPRLGFYPATFVFLICLGAALGLRNPWKLAALGAVPTAGCYLVFHEVFALRLPTGPWL